MLVGLDFSNFSWIIDTVTTKRMREKKSYPQNTSVHLSGHAGHVVLVRRQVCVGDELCAADITQDCQDAYLPDIATEAEA